MPVDSANVGVAFGLVIAAGAATALGAAVVFFPKLVKLASRRVLAASLGISAGVMLYVSFVEILRKAEASFIDAGHSEENAYIFSTLCFFGGVITMLLVDLLVKKLSGEKHHHDLNDENLESSPTSDHGDVSVVVPHCVGCADDPVGELEEWQRKAEEEDNERNRDLTVGSNPSSKEGGNNEDDLFGDNDNEEGNTSSASEGNPATGEAGAVVDSSPSVKVEMDKEENRKLVRMGISTALAIGIHNFPEGLATFVAALDDPSVGAVLAIAIGIHNIPEGLCVALPIYYATGDRRKAFMWACISGISEPIGAFLGWAVLARTMSDSLYAVLFGFVAGMMVIISTKELLPTAHRYDPEDSVVTYSTIVGMVIMALSLVLFVV